MFADLRMKGNNKLFIAITVALVLGVLGNALATSSVSKWEKQLNKHGGESV